MYKHFYKNDVELIYSVFHAMIGQGDWFCRIWEGVHCREAYGFNKFEAYRNARNSKLDFHVSDNY